MTLQKKKFFIYDEIHYLTHTLFTELNKKVQIYGLITTDAIALKSSVLVTPKNSLKFNVLEKNTKKKLYFSWKIFITHITHNDSGVSITVKLKAAATKKLRLKIVGYSQCKYFYTTPSVGQIMILKRFNVTRDNNIAA